MEKFDRSYLRKIRYAVQWGLFVLIAYSGYKFYLFVRHFEKGTALLVERPPSVEGFMPIGALMAFKYWLITGIFDPIHPAALVIFIAAIGVALILKKGFCGWICPVGALSDVTWKIGMRILGKNFIIPGFLDYSIRSIKYILMGFFLYVILIKMSSDAITAFLEEPYWKVADVKLLKFFTEMSKTTMITLSALFVLSTFYKNFWCRYLCPYGALLGLLSFFSPYKITRNEKNCTHCGKCTENCPSLLPVEGRARIKSPECIGCLTCVSHCPAKGALDVALPKKRPINPLVFASLILMLFFGIIAVGKLIGHWHSSVTYEKYNALIPMAHMLKHP